LRLLKKEGVTDIEEARESDSHRKLLEAEYEIRRLLGEDGDNVIDSLEYANRQNYINNF
jgi:hypothetical protein